MCEITENCEVYRDSVIIREEIRTKIDDSQRQNKEYYDKRSNKNVKFSRCDIVYVKVDHVNTGESTKLQPRYKGPYVISKELTNVSYVISRLVGGRKMHRPLTAHDSQLKLWRGRDKYSELDNNDENCDNDETCDKEVSSISNDASLAEEILSNEICDKVIDETEIIKEVENKITNRISEKEESSENMRVQRYRRPPTYLKDYIQV